MVQPLSCSHTSFIDFSSSDFCNAPVKSLHHFVPDNSFYSIDSCYKFKSCTLKDSEGAQFLTKLSSSNDINWKEHQEKIADFIIKTPPYTPLGHLLTGLLKKADKQSLKDILQLVFDKMFESSNEKYEDMINILDPETILAFKDKQMADELQEMAECLPKPKVIKRAKIESEIKKTLSVIIKFFPNFLDTVLKAFNLIEAGKTPESIWDFAAMLEIYFKLFMLPCAVFAIVGALVAVSWQVVLITLLIVVAAVVGICLYLKFRPCPTKLPWSVNLTEEAKHGKLEPVIGRDKEIQKVGSYLGMKKNGVPANLILVGEAGVGKTELVKGIAGKFQEKMIFSLNAAELASGFGSISDKLRLLFLDIKGHEREVVFFLDELGEAIKKNPTANIAGYLKPLIGPDGVQVIAALSSQEYKDHILTDKALADRFTKIDVHPTTKDETVAILEGRIENKGKSLKFKPKIAESIYNITKGQLQPRNSVNLLDLAINRANAFDMEKFVSPELQQCKTLLNQKQKTYSHIINEDDEGKAQLAQEIKGLKETIAKLEIRDKNTHELALKVKRLIQKQKICLNQRNTLASNASKENMLLFLHYIILPWMKDKIDNEIKEIKDIPMQVDEAFIKQIHNELTSG